jgi:integrase/recombinase XerC
MSGAKRPHGGSTPTSASISVRQAAAAYLDTIQVPTTHRVYAQTIGKTADTLGPDRALTEVEDIEVGAALQALWGTAAASTWNTRRSAVSSWLEWCRGAGHPGPAVPPSATPRPVSEQTTTATRVHSRAEIDKLTSRTDIPVRETALWRIIYETDEPALAMLALNVEDLDLASHSARLHRSGALKRSRGKTSREVTLGRRRVFWGPVAGHLLARHLEGRTAGPVFLASRQPRPGQRRDEHDLDPETGFARLTYSSAEKHLDRYTAKDGPGTGWNLHELRVSSRLHAQLDQAVAAVAKVWRLIGNLDPALAQQVTEATLPDVAAAARDLAESDRPLAAAGEPIAEAIITIIDVIAVAEAPGLFPTQARRARQDLNLAMALSEAAEDEVLAVASRARAASGARR